MVLKLVIRFKNKLYIIIDLIEKYICIIFLEIY